MVAVLETKASRKSQSNMAAHANNRTIHPIRQPQNLLKAAALKLLLLVYHDIKTNIAYFTNNFYFCLLKVVIGYFLEH